MTRTLALASVVLLAGCDVRRRVPAYIGAMNAATSCAAATRRPGGSASNTLIITAPINLVA